MGENGRKKRMQPKMRFDFFIFLKIFFNVNECVNEVTLGWKMKKMELIGGKKIIGKRKK